MSIMNFGRERFIEYVKRGGQRPYVSLQIGAVAGFECKLAGKQWASEASLTDAIRAYEIVGCDPLLMVEMAIFKATGKAGDG